MIVDSDKKGKTDMKFTTINNMKSTAHVGMATLLDNYFKGNLKAYGTHKLLDMEPLWA